MLKEQKGITLVALVITIIVLLILAGISISLALGNNGIITNAQKSSFAWTQGEAETQLAMAFAACETNYQVARADDSTANRADFYTKDKINAQLVGTGYTLDTEITTTKEDKLVFDVESYKNGKDVTVKTTNGDKKDRDVEVKITQITIDAGQDTEREEEVVSVVFSKYTEAATTTNP